ncbi:MAG: AgmX/PglI C-terminal domain-containing protein [Polyangiales bacterium]
MQRRGNGWVGQSGLVGVLSAAAFAGCGGEPAESTPPPAAVSSGAEAFSAPRQGMQVEGLLGTIPSRRIEETLQAKLPVFQRCFADGSRDVEKLGGHLKFYFHVGLDGAVEWVQPRGSSVGHRATELCLLSRAKQVHFPAPKGGGPAEFTWGFEFEPAEQGQPMLVWEAAQVASVTEQHRAELSACGVAEPGHYVVTAYVQPGGQVLAAGAATDTPPDQEDLDCVVSQVLAWQFPDPGASGAKVSFPL